MLREAFHTAVYSTVTSNPLRNQHPRQHLCVRRNKHPPLSAAGDQHRARESERERNTEKGLLTVNGLSACSTGVKPFIKIPNISFGGRWGMMKLNRQVRVQSVNMEAFLHKLRLRSVRKTVQFGGFSNGVVVERLGGFTYPHV